VGGRSCTAFDRLLLALHKLLDAICDIPDHGIEVVALQLCLAADTELLQEILQAGNAMLTRLLQPCTGDTLQRATKITVRHQVVRERVEQFVGVDRGLLGAVPTRVPVYDHAYLR
jgi:hypothetical protein